MGGLEWAAIPIVVEMFGVLDPAEFIVQLVAIRDWQKQRDKDNS